MAASTTKRSMVTRFTAKAGPLPVWGWAVLILAAGYLAYRLTAGKTTSSPTAAADSTQSDTPPTPSGDTGSPPASGQGGAADNMNSDLLSQLSGQIEGVGGSVDALTGLIQSTPAFPSYSGGDAGAGSDGSGTTSGSGGGASSSGKATASTPVRPSAAPRAPARVRYYTFQPGRAPRGRKGDEAPARGPAGTTLHFARGKGYYYA